MGKCLLSFLSGEHVTTGGKGTYNLVNHAFSLNTSAGIIADLSLQILHQALTFLGVMGADPGAAPLSLSHNGQDNGQLFKNMPDLREKSMAGA